jgi:hypothetical protein
MQTKGRRSDAVMYSLLADDPSAPG